jgi:hypothetical protein
VGRDTRREAAICAQKAADKLFKNVGLLTALRNDLYRIKLRDEMVHLIAPVIEEHYADKEQR